MVRSALQKDNNEKAPYLRYRSREYHHDRHKTPALVSPFHQFLSGDRLYQNKYIAQDSSSHHQNKIQSISPLHDLYKSNKWHYRKQNTDHRSHSVNEQFSLYVNYKYKAQIPFRPITHHPNRMLSPEHKYHLRIHLWIKEYAQSYWSDSLLSTPLWSRHTYNYKDREVVCIYILL